jgi:hypothetical protein
MARQSAAITAAVLALAIVGCNRPSDDGIPSAEKAQADTLSAIAERSGGDWNRLTDADRTFLKQQAGGDEKSAQMLLMAKSGKLRGNAGGPPGPRR